MATILTVDDSTSMRQMVSFTLMQAGYDVAEAVDGVAGLNKARSGRFHNNYKFTPTLLLTTESGADKKKQGMEAGATGWLVKPFDQDNLLHAIKKVIG